MKKKQLQFKSYKKNSRFYNNAHEVRSGFIINTVYMFCGSIFHRIRDLFRGVHSWGLYEKPIKQSEPLAVTWIGHSTFLIQAGGINILVDPLFGNASLFFRRLLPSGISLDRLPHIDCILLSHNHRDHMEKRALLSLKKRDNPAIFVPEGLGQWFERRGFNQVKEFDWWEQATYRFDNSKSPIKLTFLPARHWSQRMLLDKNRSLWGSWLIEYQGYTIYFAGDTTYSGHFKSIAEAFPRIDIAFLPIAPCEPHSLLKDAHMGPLEAGQAFCDLGAYHFIPMHWGTFHFGIEPFDLSINRLCKWWSDHKKMLTDKQLHIFKIGQRLTF